MRNTKLEVNTSKFLNNIDKIKAYCKEKEIMPVVKANAYGTYLNKRIDILNNFNIVAVALVDEGINLRKDGYQNEIFVLNQPSIDEIPLIIENNLTIGLSDESFIRECLAKNVSINSHLEIETGMNRTGISLDKLGYILNIIKNSNIKIEGLYTHLSSADYDKNYTSKQIETFKSALNILKQEEISLKYIHVSASNGLLNYKLDFTNLVRPGIIMYGYESFAGSKEKIDVEPILTLKTNITFLKTCHEGEKIGYSQKYTCEKDSRIATIPIGYADGLRRELSNKGHVLIKNKLCKIVGNVCMDSCMVDVSNIDDLNVGEEVIIFDEKNITVDDIARECNTINYEIISTIGSRVPRIFI